MKLQCSPFSSRTALKDYDLTFTISWLGLNSNRPNVHCEYGESCCIIQSCVSCACVMCVKHFTVVVTVAIGFIGLAVCLTIVCVGVICFRRLAFTC